MSRKRRNRRPEYEPEPSSGGLRLGLVIAVLVGINLYVFLWRGGTSIPSVMEKAAVAGQDGALVDAPQETPSAELPAITEPAESSLRTQEGTVKPGDSMGLILRREGLSTNAADELIRALSQDLDLRRIRAGQEFTLEFSGEGQLQRFSFVVSKKQRVEVLRGADGKLSSKRVDSAE